MSYLYAVQWIDHGGPYHEPNWQNEVPTVLEQMGFDPNVILNNIGGISLHNQKTGMTNMFGFIETTVELPEWDGMKKSSPRWVEQISLWFYTFTPNPKIENIVDRWDVDEFDNVFYN